MDFLQVSSNRGICLFLSFVPALCTALSLILSLVPPNPFRDILIPLPFYAGNSQILICHHYLLFKPHALSFDRQVSRGSAGEDQADEQARVARLSWRVSGR